VLMSRPLSDPCFVVLHYILKKPSKEQIDPFVAFFTNELVQVVNLFGLHIIKKGIDC
jgi:hypothetical protein